MTTVKRIIHFYELVHLNFRSKPEELRDYLFGAFQLAINLNTTLSKYRFTNESDSALCTRDLEWDTVNRRFKGKLCKIRKDVFPELFDTESDVIRDIEASEDEGIVEITHFILDMSKTLPMLAIEFNQYGAKIQHFERFFSEMANRQNAPHKINALPVVRDTLPSFLNRISRCSEFVVRIHKDNLARIQDINMGLYSAARESFQFGEPEYATIKLDFDWRKKEATTGINNKIFEIIRSFLRNRDSASAFDEIYLTAEDSEYGNRLNLFDLLADKVRSVVKIERRERTRSLVSLDMFTQIEEQMIKQIFNDSK